MRLIDADALSKALGFAEPCANCKHVYGVFLCDDAIWQEVCDAIYDAPTIDAVQVIHCRDCTHYAPAGDGDPNGGCTITYSYMSEDGYCSDGERKTNP